MGSTTENEAIEVLLIEDNPDDADLMRRKLDRSANARFSVTSVRTLKEGLEHLTTHSPDLILSDLGLPDSHGLDTVSKVLYQASHIPVVVLSGFDDEDIAIKAVKLGAQDYLVKGNMEGGQLERSLFYAIERSRLQGELEQYTQELWKTEANLRKILEKNADAIVVVGEDNRILFANPAVESLMHRSQKELLNKPFAFPVDGNKISEVEINHNGQDKTIAEMSVVDINWEGKSAHLASLHDITKRKRMEEALRESEEKFSKAFRSSPESIAITRLEDGAILEVNEGFTRLTGRSREEVIGRTSHEVNAWVNESDRAQMVKTLKEKGRVSNEEYKFRKKSGEIRSWLFSAELINIGNETCIISITTDITDLKQAEEALRFSHAAFKSIHEGVIATDTEYNVTHWNEISEQMYGLKASAAIGKKLFDVIEIVETHPGENHLRFKTLENNGYYREEQLHRTKYGEVWVDASFQAIEDGGKRYGWVVLTSAITQRKLAEDALKRSEEKYRELINTSLDGIVSNDGQMRVIIWNQGAERIFGYTEREMLGQPILKVVPERERKRAKEIMANLSRPGPGKPASQIIEGIGLKKDGTEVPIELSVSARKAGETYIYTAIIRDITERKEAEEKLRRIGQMKSEFLSNVAHELRTPLQSISGFTKLIMNGQVPDPDTQQEFLQIIDRESLHLGNLINDLLDMSRLESGRFQIYPKLLPIRDTIVDSVKSFHGLARDKNIRLSEDIPPELPEMEVDGERLRQVVINLLSNAIKFSNPGGSVTVKAKRRKTDLLFKVADQGIGIPQEAMLHLFERFYQAEDMLAKGGTGLGLYISKQIIEAHGGRIWAESKIGEGSTFSFTLPLNGKGGNGHGKENSGHRR